MRYMLDTNMCIYLMKNEPSSVRVRFDRMAFGEVVMSVMTLAELQCGVVRRSTDQARVAASIEHLLAFVPSLPFDDSAALAYARLFNAVRARRRDTIDRLIAAHAMSLGLTLVTNNERGFIDYPGLAVENWVAADR